MAMMGKVVRRSLRRPKVSMVYYREISSSFVSDLRASRNRKDETYNGRDGEDKVDHSKAPRTEKSTSSRETTFLEDSRAVVRNNVDTTELLHKHDCIRESLDVSTTRTRNG